MWLSTEIAGRGFAWVLGAVGGGEERGEDVEEVYMENTCQVHVREVHVGC